MAKLNVPPVQYKDEIDLAVKLHLSSLAVEFERIVKSDPNQTFESNKAYDDLKRRMKECEQFLENYNLE